MKFSVVFFVLLSSQLTFSTVNSQDGPSILDALDVALNETDVDFDNSTTVAPTVIETPNGGSQAVVVDENNSSLATSQPSAAVEDEVIPPSAVSASTVSVVGQVPLKLVNTPSLLIGSVELEFLSAVNVFLQEKFEAGLGEGDTLDVAQIGLMRQYRKPQQPQRRALTTSSRDRHLQAASSPLFVDLRVVAQHTSSRENGGALDLSALLGLLFETFADDFVVLVQEESEDPFFNSLETVQVVPPEASLTASPTETPGTSPTFLDVFQGDDSDNNNNDFWSIGVIVGVGAAGAVILILLLAIICRLTSTKRRNASHAVLMEHGVSRSGSSLGYGKETTLASSGSGSKDAPARRAVFTSRKVERQDSDQGYPASSSSGLALQEQASDLESQGVYSYIKADSDSMVGGSVMQNNSVYGHDDMSYAYSLQPGLEPSVAPGYSVDQSTIFHRDDSYVPMEIPQISVPGISSYGGPNLEATLNRKMEEAAKEMDLSPSDLRLTESEIAMLPSNLRDSFEKSQHKQTPTPTTRVVMAPPGKLGIVIDTTIDGPVVHHVNRASALKEQIFPGDIIVAIDNIDTRAMSASAITGLMVQTAKQKRRLTIQESSSTKPVKSSKHKTKN